MSRMGYIGIALAAALLLFIAGVTGVNPRWFGAVCDGRHDDTGAFRHAVSVGRLLGRPVLVPDNCVVNYLDIGGLDLQREVK